MGNTPPPPEDQGGCWGRRGRYAEVGGAGQPAGASGRMSGAEALRWVGALQARVEGPTRLQGEGRAAEPPPPSLDVTSCPGGQPRPEGALEAQPPLLSGLGSSEPQATAARGPPPPSSAPPGPGSPTHKPGSPRSASRRGSDSLGRGPGGAGRGSLRRGSLGRHQGRSRSIQPCGRGQVTSPPSVSDLSREDGRRPAGG